MRKPSQEWRVTCGYLILSALGIHEKCSILCAKGGLAESYKVSSLDSLLSSTPISIVGHNRHLNDRFAEVELEHRCTKVQEVATYLCRRETNGGNPISAGSRRGGVWFRVGGVDASDTPDEPAVEGLVSIIGDSIGVDGWDDDWSLRGAGFFRVGTPSGHVH